MHVVSINNCAARREAKFANFGVPVTFLRQVTGKCASYWRHDLITSTFDVIAHVGAAGYPTPSLY